MGTSALEFSRGSAASDGLKCPRNQQNLKVWRNIRRFIILMTGPLYNPADSVSDNARKHGATISGTSPRGTLSRVSSAESRPTCCGRSSESTEFHTFSRMLRFLWSGSHHDGRRHYCRPLFTVSAGTMKETLCCLRPFLWVKSGGGVLFWRRFCISSPRRLWRSTPRILALVTWHRTPWTGHAV